MALGGGGVVAAAVGSADSGAGAAVSTVPAHRPAGTPSRVRTTDASTVASPTDGSFLSAAQQATLGAAVARLVPASGPGDWSAADLGVVDYIDNLLSGFGRDPVTGGIYPGGPYRASSSGGSGFSEFRPLTAAKTLGWRRQVFAWQDLYTDGLAGLDEAAAGDFAAAPGVEQDLILHALDDAASPFFGALFDHTMEGTYSHPVYGGNRGYASWQWLGFGGDVHGVRFPTTGSRGPWNVYGGYAPEEIAGPGTAATEQPVVTSAPPTQW
jgi:gluconate 2-dehydrogenase gamma chain